MKFQSKKLYVIILANTANTEFYDMTLSCINSIRNSAFSKNNPLLMKIRVIESCKFQPLTIITESGDITYKIYGEDVEILTPKEDFEYNKFMNIGLENISEEYFNDPDSYVLMVNNDVVVDRMAIQECIKQLDLHENYESCSAFTENWHTHINDFQNETNDVIFNNTRSWGFTGWFHLVKSSFFKKIPKFDEDFKFHYCDDDLVMTMNKVGVKHFLCRKAIIKHNHSSSHQLISEDNQHAFLHDSSVFVNKWCKS